MASGTISVRVMRPEDVPGIVEIDGMASGSPRADYIQGKASQALDSKHSMVISLVAESHDQVIGFLMGQVFLGEFGIPESVATVDTVGIHPSRQGMGIARLLMEEFLSHAAKAGVERVRTLVDWNQGDLLDFFRAMGFAPATSLVLERPV